MKIALALLTLLLLPAVLPAQPPAPPQPPASAPAAPAAQDTRIQEILQLIQAGDAAKAFQKIQELEKDPAATPAAKSLAGALYLEVDKPQEAFVALKPLADAETAEPAVLYQAGRAALALGRKDEARTYLTRSLTLEPASPAARELGLLTAREGRVVEAYSMLRPWALRNGHDAEARLMAATLALTLERPDDAAELLQGMTESDPALRLLRGRVLVQKKDGPGAAALLRPLLDDHPQGMDLEVRRTLAEAELLAGRPAEAVKLLQGKAGSHPSLALLLGRAQRQAGDAAGATATLKPFAEKLPADAAAFGDPRPAAGIAAEYGLLLLDGGQAAESVAYLEKATRFYPRSPEAWRGLARALEATGRKDEAQQALAKAEEAAKPAASRGALAAAAAPPAAAPTQAPAAPPKPLSEGLQNAFRLMSQGQLDSALVAARQDFGITKDPRARMVEIQTLLALKRPEEAATAVETALRDDPENIDFLYLRGAVGMALQRWSAAEQDFRKVLQAAPGHTAAMSDLAVLLINMNKKAEARALLQQVLRINPKDQMAAANLRRLEDEP